MKLHLKYMVSNRCRIAVKEELRKLGLDFIGLDSGEIEIKQEISEEQRGQVKVALTKSGFELMDDKKAILIQEIKNIIVEMINSTDDPHTVNFSDYLSEKLGYHYTYLTNLFSEVTGTTIEQFTINQKIERVKELLIYDELNLTQISYKLHYSSVAYLSNQFRKITGLTPTFFKRLKLKKRPALVNL